MTEQTPNVLYEIVTIHSLACYILASVKIIFGEHQTIQQIRSCQYNPLQGYSKWLSGFWQLVIQNTLKIGVYVFFLFNRTTLQVFATYLICALYVHPLWFYKYQHDNRVRSKLFVACQRWWFQWRFWLYNRKRCTYRAPIRYVTKTWSVVLLNKKKKIHILISQVYCVWQAVKTPKSFRITL